MNDSIPAGWYDSDTDGALDTEIFDQNGDGVGDGFQMDTNSDGYIDLALVDTDGDGASDTLKSDPNQDGFADAMATDTNGDGVFDAYEGPETGNQWVSIVQPEPQLTFGDPADAEAINQSARDVAAQIPVVDLINTGTTVYPGSYPIGG